MRLGRSKDKIGDHGAAAWADALHANSTLQHLDLSGDPSSGGKIGYQGAALGGHQSRDRCDCSCDYTVIVIRVMGQSRL